MNTYGLSCVCLISKRVKLDSPYVWMWFAHTGKRLTFDDDGVVKEKKLNISIMIE